MTWYDEQLDRISVQRVRVARLRQQLGEAEEELARLERRIEPPYPGVEFSPDLTPPALRPRGRRA